MYTCVAPISYDNEAQRWELGSLVDDFASENLRIYMDVDEDEAALHDEVDGGRGKYVLILVGRRQGRGITIVPMETVCLLGRRLSTPSEVETVFRAREFQQRIIEAEEKDAECVGDDWTDWRLLTLGQSYRRVGLVRGAGSFDAWERAGLLKPEAVFLF